MAAGLARPMPPADRLGGPIVQHRNEFLTVCEAAERVPGCPAKSSVWRWCRWGVKSPQGHRIRLAHRRVGGRILIGVDALDAFLSALAQADAAHFNDVTAGGQTP